MISREEWYRELAARRAAVWEIVQRQQGDVGLIFGSFGHSEPFRYLTNFVPVLGDTWAVMRGADDITAVMNFHWQTEEARDLSGIQDWRGEFNAVPTVIELLRNAAPSRIAVVGLHRMPVTAYEAIRAALPNATFVDIGADVAALRRIKSQLEIRLLREAGRITDAAFDAIRSELKPGLTEFEVAAKLAYTMQSLGGELSFEPTVVSGNDRPIMIRRPTDRRLERGDSVMIDIGAMYQGYQADAARTYVLGEPNAQQEKVWETVRRAYAASIELCRPGVPAVELHRAAVSVIEGAGHRLIHRVGHGIGLSTSFEWPSLDSETAPLKAGMTFCIEPGIYVAGAGNMKFEDDVLITDTAYELLTRSAPDLVVPI